MPPGAQAFLVARFAVPANDRPVSVYHAGGACSNIALQSGAPVAVAPHPPVFMIRVFVWDPGEGGFVF